MSLTVTIAETLTLNEFDSGSSVAITQGDVTYYTKKVVAITTDSGGTSLYTCSSDGTSADFDYDLVKHARITNLHATESIHLSVKVRTGTAHYVEIIISPKGNFVINSHNSWMSNSTTVAQGVVKEVKAKASGSGVSAEVFIGYED
tara:strand:+ start:1142 stop:1579 length:438 start_codon:yes stop_codon:yes gene_type:complete